MVAAAFEDVQVAGAADVRGLQGAGLDAVAPPLADGAACPYLPPGQPARVRARVKAVQDHPDRFSSGARYRPAIDPTEPAGGRGPLADPPDPLPDRGEPVIPGRGERADRVLAINATTAMMMIAAGMAMYQNLLMVGPRTPARWREPRCTWRTRRG